MRIRVAIGTKIIQLGTFIQSLAVTVMRPVNLVEFSRISYSMENCVSEWSGDNIISAGLSPNEKNLVNKIPVKKGKLLLLGVGGGREAIPFAKMGFEVTGMDFIPEMVEKAKSNAKMAGVSMEGLVQELSSLNLKFQEYDVVWLSSAMYSSIPTRKNRKEMLERICSSLKPEGFFACQFHWSNNQGESNFLEILRKFIAIISLGNFGYERGDMLWFNKEFTHVFSSVHRVQSEFTSTGFRIIDFTISSSSRGEVLLKKN